MKNLEIIKNKNGGYGIRDLDTGKVIIPGMYKKSQLESITEIIPLSYYSPGYSSDIYELKGFNIESKEVYGLYNSHTNDFVDVIYDRISLVMHTNADGTTNNELRLVQGDNRINYDLTASQDNTSIKEKFKMFTNDNITYGLVDAEGRIVIPAEYTRKEIFDIGDIEIINGIYILKDKEDSGKIVGFYDARRGILQKGTFTSYEILSNVLVLRNRVESNNHREKKTDDLLISKTYISLYDPRNGKYITGDFYDREMEIYESDGYSDEWYNTITEEGLIETDGIIILNSKAFYDTITGNWQDHVLYYKNDGKSLIVKYTDREVDEYYDIKERKFIKYTLICKEIKDHTSIQLYLSEDKKTIRFGDEDYPIEVYSDFIKISDRNFTILLDRNYNFLSYHSAHLEILEIKPEDVVQLGIRADSSKSVYSINGELYTFRKRNKIIRGTYPNFIQVPRSVIGAVEFEYGTCSVEASSAAELEDMLNKIEQRRQELSSVVENAFYQDETLMEEYPKLVKGKK